jgi:hypothetical protein
LAQDRLLPRCRKTNNGASDVYLSYKTGQFLSRRRLRIRKGGFNKKQVIKSDSMSANFNNFSSYPLQSDLQRAHPEGDDHFFGKISSEFFPARFCIKIRLYRNRAAILAITII